MLAPFADPNPDGLESAADEHDAPEGQFFDIGLFTDYGAEGSVLYNILGNEFFAIIISGLIGVSIVLITFLIPGLYLYKRRTKTSSQN